MLFNYIFRIFNKNYIIKYNSITDREFSLPYIILNYNEIKFKI